MPDAETLTLALTFTGTLAVAALMFLGQLAAFTVLLALAGIVRLLTLPVAARTRRKKPTPTEH
jgi:threonine/homoserine efflux transporter RhtA